MTKPTSKWPPWQPGKTAPTDGTEILGYWSASKTYALIFWYENDVETGEGWWQNSDIDDGPVSGPTHWMLLPNPPKGSR